VSIQAVAVGTAVADAFGWKVLTDGRYGVPPEPTAQNGLIRWQK
jgi:hypothetical protein